MPRLSRLCGCLAVLAGFASPTAAGADEQVVCSKGDLVSPGTNRTVRYFDAGEAGTSVGDVRVGKRTLTDSDGRSLGEARWRNTAIAPLEGADTSLFVQDFYFILDDGVIMTRALIPPKSDMSDTEKVSASSRELAVLGGTGAYRSVSGVVTMTVGADDDAKRLRFSFDVEC